MSSSDNDFVQERQRNPFAGTQELAVRPATALGALASAEQQRALGELQAQLMLAKMNPRDPQAAVDNILRDCSRITLAQAGQYEYARGGTDIRGPSIKLMEAIARRWGNINSGFKIVHSENGASDVLTYAWDLETGYRDERQFQVRHIRDTRKGPVPVTDERDIYELIANMSQRRKRSCLQAVIPADVVEAAVEQCQDTLHANVDTSVEGLKKLLRAFAEFGVTQTQIEQRIQSRLEAITPGQVVQLRRIYTSLQDGMSVPSQWFRAVDPPPRPTRQSAISPRYVVGQQEKKPETPAETPPAGPVDQTPHSSLFPETPAEKPETVAETPAETPETEEIPEDVPDTGAEFGHVVVGVDGEPIDGEVILDPLTWAQQFLDVWTRTTDRDTLVFHNADALADARATSPEADALLDGIEAAEEAVTAIAEAVNEPPVDENERIAALILQELPRLATATDVIAYSKSGVVMVPIQRWQKEGRTGLLTSVKGAFTARLEALRGGHA